MPRDGSLLDSKIKIPSCDFFLFPLTHGVQSLNHKGLSFVRCGSRNMFGLGDGTCLEEEVPLLYRSLYIERASDP